MRYIFLLIGISVAALVGLSVIGQSSAKDPPAKEKRDPKLDRKKVKELMGQKTEHSQKVLEALMKNDMTAAEKHANELLRIRKEAAWLVVKSDVYNLWSDQFAMGAEKIAKAAKDKNPELAKLGYLEMTMVCFNCHSYARDLGVISTATDH